MASDRDYSIRKANPGDAKLISDYLKVLIGEGLEQLPALSFPVDEKSQAELIVGFEKTNSFLLLLLSKDTLIGMIDFISGKTPERSHCGRLGISIKKEFRNQGYGKLLLRRFLELSAQLPDIRRIELEVLSNNPVAIKLYKELHFVEEGIKKDAVLHKGQSLDLHMMVYRPS